MPITDGLGYDEPDQVTYGPFLKGKEAGKEQQKELGCMDFDGVMFEHKSSWPLDKIGMPLKKGFDDARALIKQGYQLVVLTARPKQYHKKMEAALRNNGLSLKVTNKKPPAAFYIDDRAVPSAQNVANHIARIKKEKERQNAESGGQNAKEAGDKIKRIVKKRPFDVKEAAFLAEAKRIVSGETRFREYGVKGMKWGFHKDRDESGKGDVKSLEDARGLVQSAVKEVGSVKDLFNQYPHQPQDEHQKKDEQVVKKAKEAKDAAQKIVNSIKAQIKQQEYGSDKWKGLKKDLAQARKVRNDAKAELKKARAGDYSVDPDKWGNGNAREGLFAAAGVSKSDYKDFNTQIHNWVVSGGGKDHPIRKAAAEIANGAKNPSGLAKCLMVEAGLNREYYGGGKLKVYRGMDGKIADKIATEKFKGVTNVSLQLSHADHYSVSKSTAKSFASGGGIVVKFRVPKENILLSYKTNSWFNNYQGEKEIVALLPQAELNLTLGKDIKSYRKKKGGYYDD